MLQDSPAGSSIVYEWIYYENELWTRILGAISADTLPYETSSLFRYKSILSEQLEYHNRNKHFEHHKLNTIIHISKENFIPNHDQRTAKDIFKNSEDLNLIRQLLYANYLLDQTINQFFNGTVTTKYKEMFEEKIEEFEKAKQNFADSTKHLSYSLTEQNERITKEINEITETAKKNLSNQTEDHIKEISERSSNINKNIDSSKPVRFWEDKETNHRLQAKSCKKAAITLGFFASILMLFLTLAAFKDPNTTSLLGFQLPNHFYLAALVLLGSAFVWALRITIQLMMTHIALESEALERSTAIKTYISLSSQNIDKDIENEFHRSLLSFNKVKISEDSNHPEIFKVIEQFLKKDKS